jgi:hypothetical protein
MFIMTMVAIASFRSRPRMRAFSPMPFPRDSLRALGLGLICCLVAAGVRADCYQVEARAVGVAPPCFGMELVVLSATQTKQDLWFRVGVRNLTTDTYRATKVLACEDISLTAYVQGKRLTVEPTTITLSQMFPSAGLKPGAMHAGVFTFPWGEREAPLERLGSMELRVAGFATVDLRLDAGRRFDPVDWKQVERRSVLNVEVIPKVEQLAIFPMRIHSMIVRDEELEFAVSFRNAHRLPVKWTGKLGGRMAVLITAHHETLMPSAVSDSLAGTIAPPSSEWAAGEDHVGWIRFPLPHSHASERLSFALPGYGVTELIYDREGRMWRPAVAEPSDGSPALVVAMLDEERTFGQLRSFWEEKTRALRQREWSVFLKRFRGAALEDQRAFVPLWERAPITAVEYRLSEFQAVKPDEEGRLRNVKVELCYMIDTLPTENLFVTHAVCDMQRDEKGEWHVDFIRYTELQPFWMLGYTETLSSEHFLIFHRPDEENAKQADLAVKQLEKGYVRLLRTGLKLKSRYAAFSIAQKNDFEKLTGRDPMTYSGGASSAYIYQKAGVSVINQALYLNDFRFFTLQRAWGKQDRQVTILHELVHLALADYTRPWTPSWLTEGTAMYFADQVDSGTRSFLREHLLPITTIRELSKLSYLGAGVENPHEVNVQYQFSGQTAAWLAKHYGESGLLNLYTGYATNVPEEWRAYRGDGGNTLIAASRLRIATRILDQTIPGLTLDTLDAEVRASVGK